MRQIEIEIEKTENGYAIDRRSRRYNLAIMEKPLAAPVPADLKKIKRSLDVFCATWGLLAVAHFSLSYLRNSSNFSLTDYVEGRAPIPFQYRMLMMPILRGLVHIPHWNGIAAKTGLFADDPYKFALFVIVFLSMAAALVFVRLSLLALDTGKLGANLGALLLLYMCYFSLDTNYVQRFLTPYDVPSLMFFAGCIWAVLTHRTALFYLLFIFGTLNRETTIFLILFFAICAAVEQRKWLVHAVVFMAIWIALKMWIRQMFHLNPTDTSNSLFAFKLFWNLKEILKPWQWPSVASIFGFLFPLYVAGFRYISDRRVAIAGAWMIGAWTLGMMITGVIIEVRIFTELNVIMAISLTLIAKNWLASTANGREVPVGLS